MVDAQVTATFWSKQRDNIANEVIPYQWAVINDDQEVNIPVDPSGVQVENLSNNWSHAVRNFKVAAGEMEAEFNGMVFQDSDVYKWLEEAAYVIAYTGDQELKHHCDELVNLISRAQEEDGYLDTPFQIKSGSYANRPRFTQIQQSHEMYVMGHYIEAAVAYYEVTGNEKALDTAKGMADCLHDNFGPDKEKIQGADGHPEIELALARLYEVSNNRKYLDLAQFFVDVRGRDPEFYDKQNAAAQAAGATPIFPQMLGWSHEYTQTARTLREQQTAEGHAVRVAYLLTGAAHIARLADDPELQETVKRLWNNIVRKRMYITGGVGSTSIGEAFTYDYDLPNDTMYAESCASVGMSFLARQMLELEPKGEYAEVLEKQIFNGAISGISLDGTHFYYVNPLEADPLASEKNPDRSHVLMKRAEWFGCACCPANIARFIASIDRYIYVEKPQERRIVAHQFIASDATFFEGISIKQESEFPWDGHIRLAIDVPQGIDDIEFLLRIPAWSMDNYSLRVNGVDVTASEKVIDGFVYLQISEGTTVIELDLDMSVKFMRANNAVRHAAGKVAVMRGPIVYCAEETDNQAPIWNYILPHNATESIDLAPGKDVLDGAIILKVPAVKRPVDETFSLYENAAETAEPEECILTMVPYFCWANREIGQMQIWFDSDF